MGERSTHISAKSQKMRHTLGPKSGADCQRNIGKRRSHAGTMKTPDCKTLADKEESSRFRPKLRVSPQNRIWGLRLSRVSGSLALRVSRFLGLRLSGSPAFRGFHRMTPEKPKRALWVVHGLESRPHFHEKTTRGKQKARNFGPSPIGSPRFLGGPHPSAPPPLGAPTLRTLRAPLRLSGSAAPQLSCSGGFEEVTKILQGDLRRSSNSTGAWSLQCRA